jgi:hypothetical protein
MPPLHVLPEIPQQAFGKRRRNHAHLFLVMENAKSLGELFEATPLVEIHAVCASHCCAEAEQSSGSDE